MPNPKQTEAPPWTILNILKWTTSYFTSHNVENPRASAEILLAHVLGVKRIDLYIRYDQPLIPAELSRFKATIRRRVRREPVAYIVGEREFWSMPIAVTPDVLIPRPETECLVETALATLSSGPGEHQGAPTGILELGTGSGAVVLALAAELKKAVFTATDRSLRAIAVARRNARRFSLEPRIRFFCGDWFACLRPQGLHFDMILSNPPYIPTAEIDRLQPEVARYEPRGALDGGADGLTSIRAIIGRAHHYLRSGGYLLLEIGYDQKADIESLAGEHSTYVQLDFIRDYSGHDRVVRLLRK
ncbi:MULTISPECIES: peptide chain release factor N(5)-glutamine methyltransferase [Desulfococcus]|uniref:Release factor glutamine methyltransferase n=1 Tax=Desulfococcus multivorans DSM 2059 TaxID=1121405 RepID=S7TWF0_DESML|nr:peptide chain release factor N(5)-glutamine methyltransferase [Desulfococcus multivorans]AQV00395.1 protein-(glutamine-N5) methyltransferase, release factor-specific [Desulfococcus multivorans]EPR41397.1 Protein-(glutamine-N5) methyltransferase, release factor-specific [Desulfococcus multivorans DSM 2059]SJZ70765.1 release factor glutamine methyltransferase [Desulfococcus multivorans DSM 2059]